MIKQWRAPCQHSVNFCVCNQSLREVTSHFASALFVLLSLLFCEYGVTHWEFAVGNGFIRALAYRDWV